MQGDGRLEMPFSWDEVGLPAGKWTHGWPAFFGYASGEGRTRGQSPPFESMDVEDEGYPDGLIANSAVSTLQRLKKYDQPFLLSVGFFKPHLPFCAPKKYYDLYDPAEITLSPNPEKPEGLPLKVGTAAVKCSEITNIQKGVATIPLIIEIYDTPIMPASVTWMLKSVKS